MRYVLNRDIALRSWPGVPYAYYKKGFTDARGLSQQAFSLLRMCDGKTDLEPSETLQELLRQELIHAQQDIDDVPTDWQRLHVYTNRYMPKMNLAITARCNCRCRHCFNAEHSGTEGELTYEELTALLDQACACGINALTVTGGEPLLFERLPEFFDAVCARGMFVFELNTNAMRLTQEFLDHLGQIGADPLIKISFDGVGTHDWMRGIPGAEKTVLQKIALCVQNGFRVMAQINVHRKNLHVMDETLSLLERYGVSSARIIRTSESPRWVRCGEDAALTVEEYYDSMRELAARYMSQGHRMPLVIWQFLNLYPETGEYSFQSATAFSPAGYSERDYLCPGVRTMIAVGPSGAVYPCMQLSGAAEMLGLSYGNVRTDSMKSLLTDSAYLRCACARVEEKLEKNAACRECEYLQDCHTGCPVLSLCNGGQYASMWACDTWKCLFFKEKHWDKCRQALQAYHNRTPIRGGSHG